VEGYVESAAVGLLAGRMAAAQVFGGPFAPPPFTTALGALLSHVTGGGLAGVGQSFQPMNINYGLLPPLDEPPSPGGAKRGGRGERGRTRKYALSLRALRDIDAWRGAAVLAA
jgi:methylenetetrahydrofolate--tRNA-(uracil-5-)-methyltransferase